MERSCWSAIDGVIVVIVPSIKAQYLSSVDRVAKVVDLAEDGFDL